MGSKRPNYCTVLGCPNSFAVSPLRTELTFHMFPKDDAMLDRWLKALGMEAAPPRRGRICSDHFTVDDFRISHRILKMPRDKWKLNRGAVPSQNLPTEDMINNKASVATQTDFEDNRGLASHLEIKTLRMKAKQLQALEKAIEGLYTPQQIEKLKRIPVGDHSAYSFEYTNPDDPSVSEPAERALENSMRPPIISPEIWSTIKSRPNKNDIEKLCIITINGKLTERKPDKAQRHANKTNFVERYSYTVVIRSLYGNWIQPIYGNRIFEMNSAHISDIILKVHKADAAVVAIVADLAFSARWLWKQCSITPYLTSFLSPYDDKSKIFVFTDVYNLLTYLKANFVDAGFSFNGLNINSEPITELIKIGKMKHLTQAHLTSTRTTNEDSKMLIQLFSNLTSHAIREWANTQTAKLPNALACADFIDIVADWFEIFNSNNAEGNAYGQVIYRQDMDLKKMTNCITNLYEFDKKRMVDFQKGILISINSLQELHRYLKKDFIITNRLNRVFDFDKTSIIKKPSQNTVQKSHTEPSTAPQAKNREPPKKLPIPKLPLKRLPSTLKRPNNDETSSSAKKICTISASYSQSENVPKKSQNTIIIKKPIIIKKIQMKEPVKNLLSIVNAPTKVNTSLGANKSNSPFVIKKLIVPKNSLESDKFVSPTVDDDLLTFKSPSKCNLKALLDGDDTPKKDKKKVSFDMPVLNEEAPKTKEDLLSMCDTIYTEVVSDHSYTNALPDGSLIKILDVQTINPKLDVNDIESKMDNIPLNTNESRSETATKPETESISGDSKNKLEKNSDLLKNVKMEIVNNTVETYTDDGKECPTYHIEVKVQEMSD